jgi:hypothetical protein
MTRGQAIPMTNPTAAMTPTFTQAGLSRSDAGTSTASGASFDIRRSFYQTPTKQAKNRFNQCC